MSLRSFHIFLISTALGLLAFLAYWSGHHHLHHSAGGFYLPVLFSSAAGFAMGGAYLTWFIRKGRS